MTNTYDAQFGQFGGGAVNTSLKSGGNTYHGDVFDYFRNSVFDANNFANNIAGQPTPFHNQHQFGEVVGAPVRKNKDPLTSVTLRCTLHRSYLHPHHVSG